MWWCYCSCYCYYFCFTFKPFTQSDPFYCCCCLHLLLLVEILMVMLFIAGRDFVKTTCTIRVDHYHYIIVQIYPATILKTSTCVAIYCLIKQVLIFTLHHYYSLDVDIRLKFELDGHLNHNQHKDSPWQNSVMVMCILFML